jgi:hypothetical protein
MIRLFFGKDFVKVDGTRIKYIYHNIDSGILTIKGIFYEQKYFSNYPLVKALEEYPDLIVPGEEIKLKRKNIFSKYKIKIAVIDGIFSYLGNPFIIESSDWSILDER